MAKRGLKDRFQEAMGDVSKLFDKPGALLADREFTADQKRKLLKQWEYDLRELQVATEENMSAPEPEHNAELLREVRDCLNKLGDEHASERPANHKHGG